MTHYFVPCRVTRWKKRTSGYKYHQGTCGPPDPPPWSNRRAGNAHMLSNHTLRISTRAFHPTRVLPKGAGTAFHQILGLHQPIHQREIIYGDVLTVDEAVCIYCSTYIAGFEEAIPTSTVP